MMNGRYKVANRKPKLGQDLSDRTSEVLSKYDALVARASLIADDEARSELLEFIGSADVPGSPAERYVAAKGMTPNADVQSERLLQLESDVSELERRVRDAEVAYGTLQVPSGAGSMPGRERTVAKCVLGGIALFTLALVPLFLD